MTKIESIAEALLIEGYLSRENVEAAVALLTQYLSAADREKYWEVEGDYSPPSRFVKAVVLRNTVRPLHTGEDATQEAFRILNSFDFPLGAVDSEAKDKIMGETQWNTAMDTRSRLYYYRTQYNYRIRVIALKTVDFGEGEIRYQPFHAEMKQDYKMVTIAQKTGMSLEQSYSRSHL